MEIIKNIRKLVKEIYKINFPTEEKYGIQSQIRRAVISISLNIVEGNSRRSRKEYLNFCNIAKGSLAEVKECLEISSDLGFIHKIGRDYIIQEHIELISKQLFCLIKYLKSETQNPKSQMPKVNKK